MRSFLHSPAWQRFQLALGQPVERAEDQLYIAHTIPTSNYWISSRCAMPSSFTLPAFCQKACFVRFEPIDTLSFQHLQAFSKQSGHKLVATKAVQPRQTLILDISNSYEEIIRNMKPKHRYNIRLAEKHGVQTEVISQDLVRHFERFWLLLSATASRQQFRTHPKSYYQKMLGELEKDQMAHLLFAHLNGQDLAAMILITDQNIATYLHGASSEHQKEVMAPYLLHAQAIQFAQSIGCTTYDFWGTDLTYNKEKEEWEAQKGHLSYGTSRFKLGFGGQVIQYPGTYDLILNSFCYTLYKTARSLRSAKSAFS